MVGAATCIAFTARMSPLWKASAKARRASSTPASDAAKAGSIRDAARSEDPVKMAIFFMAPFKKNGLRRESCRSPLNNHNIDRKESPTALNRWQNRISQSSDE